MVVIRAAALVITSLLSLTVAPLAQERPLSELLTRGEAGPLLENGYARALLDEMTAIVIESSDEACRTSKRLDAAAVKERLRKLVLQYIPLEMTRTGALVDSDAYKAGLVKHGGANAPVSLRRFLTDPAFSKIADHLRISVQEAMVDAVVGHHDRHLLLEGVKLKRPLDPLNSGNDILLKLQDKRLDELNAELEKLKGGLPFGATEPIQDLLVAHGLATVDAIRASDLMVDIRSFVPGAHERLKELCVAG